MWQKLHAAFTLALSILSKLEQANNPGSSQQLDSLTIDTGDGAYRLTAYDGAGKEVPVVVQRLDAGQEKTMNVQKPQDVNFSASSQQQLQQSNQQQSTGGQQWSNAGQPAQQAGPRNPSESGTAPVGSDLQTASQ